MGCLADGEWNESPVRTTLRRKCPTGYAGYQYRYCSELGVWSDVDVTDCGKREKWEIIIRAYLLSSCLWL